MCFSPMFPDIRHVPGCDPLVTFKLKDDGLTERRFGVVPTSPTSPLQERKHKTKGNMGMSENGVYPQL